MELYMEYFQPVFQGYDEIITIYSFYKHDTC